MAAPGVGSGIGRAAGLRARATGALGTLAWSRGDYALAAPLYERELELAEESGDSYLIAEALIDLGVLDYRTGALDRATSRISAALDRLLELGTSVASCVADGLGRLHDLR